MFSQEKVALSFVIGLFATTSRLEVVAGIEAHDPRRAILARDRAAARSARAAAPAALQRLQEPDDLTLLCACEISESADHEPCFAGVSDDRLAERQRVTVVHVP